MLVHVSLPSGVVQDVTQDVPGEPVTPCAEVSMCTCTCTCVCMYWLSVSAAVFLYSSSFSTLFVCRVHYYMYNVCVREATHRVEILTGRDLYE